MFCSFSWFSLVGWFPSSFITWTRRSRFWQQLWTSNVFLLQVIAFTAFWVSDIWLTDEVLHRYFFCISSDFALKINPFFLQTNSLIFLFFSVRKVIHWVVCQKAFDTFIMIVICLSRCHQKAHLVITFNVITKTGIIWTNVIFVIFVIFVHSFAIAAEDPVDENNPRWELLTQTLKKRLTFFIWHIPKCTTNCIAKGCFLGISTWGRRIIFSHSHLLQRFAWR